LGIEPPGVSVAQHAVGDSDAGTGPASDRPTCPEIDIVRVGHHNQRTLDLIVGKNHNHSRPMA
jgi:hypothetical protein